MFPLLPNLKTMESWLFSHEVLDPSGSVMSWSNLQNPGFNYAEAAALWLLWATGGRGKGRRLRTAGLWSIGKVLLVARRLAADIEQAGGAGKDGRIYLFDTALAAIALARVANLVLQGPPLDNGHQQRADLAVFRSAISSASNKVAQLRQAPFPADPGPASGPWRWSETWTPHLLRVWGLDRLSLLGPLPPGLSESTSAELQYYSHALAYEAEGRFMLGLPGVAEIGRRLASSQQHDGAIPAWLDGRSENPSRSDATAQAVRIWLALGDSSFRPNCERALSWLALKQADQGGIFYASDSSDINSWATLFTWQATNWYLTGFDGDWI